MTTFNSNTVGKLTMIAIAALGITFAPDARPCGKQPQQAGLGLSTLFPPLLESETPPLSADAETPLQEGQDQGDGRSGRRHAPIVGMWIVDFYDADNQLYDKATEQFYADGNEMTTDIAAAPVTDNTCYGVWEHAANRTFKLKHIGWVFDNNNFIGQFELTATLSVGNHDETFTAKYVSYVKDLSKNIIPGTYFKGVLKGKRFKID